MSYALTRIENEMDVTSNTEVFMDTSVDRDANALLITSMLLGNLLILLSCGLVSVITSASVVVFKISS